MNNVYYSNINKDKIWGGELSYTMTKSEFKEICGDNFNPQKVIDYINDTYGLLGTVTELRLED